MCHRHRRRGRAGPTQHTARDARRDIPRDVFFGGARGRVASSRVAARGVRRPSRGSRGPSRLFVRRRALRRRVVVRAPAPVVAVVTTSGCPHCRRAKTALDAANVAFVEIDASAPDGAILDASRAASGMRTVPQVFVGGVIFGGADDLEAGLASGEFASALDAASRDRRPAAPPDLARAVRTAEETAAGATTTTARQRRDAEEDSFDDDFAALDRRRDARPNRGDRRRRRHTPTDR